MTNRETYREYLQKLQTIYTLNEAGIITDWIFEMVANLNRGAILKNPLQIITDEVAQKLNKCLIELLQHKPVQYVIGEAWFFKMKFKVDEQVLIPRPETEELVQLVLQDWRPIVDNTTAQTKNIPNTFENIQSLSYPTIIDIGTGSGCIAIAIKTNLPNATMYAVDVSEGALLIAKKNATTNNAVINFKQIDFLDACAWVNLPSFDVIVSNPPYIPLIEKENLDKNVTGFEPHTALFVPNETPLLFYEKIALFGREHLNKNGKIYVEIHEDLAIETSSVFKKIYNEVAIVKDIFRKERMIVISQLIEN